MSNPTSSNSAIQWEMPHSTRRSANRAELVADQVSTPWAGYLLALSVPIAAAAVHIDFGDIGGLNVSGWLWVLYMVLGGLVVVNGVARGQVIPFPWKPWAVWLALIWLSLLWTTASAARGLQDALQLSSPILMAAVGSLCFRTPEQLKRLLHMIVAAGGLLFCIYAAQESGILIKSDDPAANRVMAITLTMSAAVILAAWPQALWLPWLGWAGCVGLALISGSRMATFAILLLPLGHPGVRGIAWRVLAVTGLLAMSVGLFYTPYLQQRFFESGSGTLEDLFRGDFLTFGRIEAWPAILDEAAKNPVFGAGVGSTFDFVPIVWPGMNHVHNDYLRIGFELGAVGLAVFLVVLLWQGIDLKRRLDANSGQVANLSYRQGIDLKRRLGANAGQVANLSYRQGSDLKRQLGATTGPLRWGLAAAILALVAFAIIAATDNILIYNLLYTNTWFLLMGACYGVLAAESARRAEHRRRESESTAESETDESTTDEAPSDKVATDKVATDKLATDEVATDEVATDEATDGPQSEGGSPA